MRPLLIMLLTFLALPGCRQVVEAVNMKQLAPEVVAGGQAPDGWYEYMPGYAPYFCLKTRRTITFDDPRMKLGYWRVLHPEPPHRVLMEARGSRLILHRSFVWDGMSFGKTVPHELIPSLLHDALYYARQGGAPVSRREVDRAFLRACRQYQTPGPYASYLCVRVFGGFFGVPPGGIPPRVVLTSPGSPPAEE